MPRVLILGAGFGGLYAVQGLARSAADVTVVDRHNYHLFQPLLYQVATASLAAPDIARSIRQILADAKNVTVLMDEVIGHMTERVVIPAADDLPRFDRKGPRCAPGDEPFLSYAPDDDGVPPIAHAVLALLHSLCTASRPLPGTDRARMADDLAPLLCGGGAYPRLSDAGLVKLFRLLRLARRLLDLESGATSSAPDHGHGA